MDKKITITKNNLASIALLYNYLATKNDSIEIEKINDYYTNFQELFFNDYNQKYIFFDKDICEIDFNRENIYIPLTLTHHYYKKNSFKAPNNLFEQDFLGIKKDDQKYYINDLEAMIINYKYFPIELIGRSLNEDLLKCIGIDPNQLYQNTYVKEYNNFMDVPSLSPQRAASLTKNNMVLNGFYDVNIKNVVLLKNYDHHSYRVYYDAKKNFNKVNVKEMVLKREKL